jgi:hypothetical protein
MVSKLAMRVNQLRNVAVSLCGLSLLGALSADVSAQDMRPELAVVSGPIEARLEAIIDLCEARDWLSLGFALGDASPIVRRFAVACWQPDEAGLQRLRPLVFDPDPDVRLRLVETLSRAADAGAVSLLAALLEDPDPSVRAAAIRRVPTTEADAARRFAPALGDPDPQISGAAAVRIAEHGAWDRLSSSQLADYNRAITREQRLLEAPEVVGAFERLVDRAQAVQLTLSDSADDMCALSTLAAIDALVYEAEAAIAGPGSGKYGDRIEQSIAFHQDLRGAVQAYHTCSTSEILVFDGSGSRADPFQGRWLSLLTELRTIWQTQFGQLRGDLRNPREGGELWVRSLLGLNLHFPGRPVGYPPPADSISVAVGGIVRRDQLFRNAEISNWNGGGFVRAHVPVPRPEGDPLLFSMTGFGVGTTADDDDFPARLVSPYRRFGGSLFTQLALEEGSIGFDLGGSSLRYQDDVLNSAAMDRLHVALNLDLPFQLTLGARSNRYARTGPLRSPDPANQALNRDALLLDAMVGVAFGESSYDESVMLRVLGGATIPVLDELERDIDPEIIFELVLSTYLADGYGQGFGFELGGRRTADSSPRDFAIQAVTSSFITMNYRSFAPYDSGVEVEFSVDYDLVSHAASLNELTELDITSIRIGFEVRFLVEEWLGFEIADRTRAVVVDEEDLEFENRFTVSLFTPIGGYGFGVEEPPPW